MKSRLKRHSTEIENEMSMSSNNLLSRKITEAKISEIGCILPKRIEATSTSKFTKDFTCSNPIVFRVKPKQAIVMNNHSSKSIINEKLNQLNEIKVLNLRLPMIDKSKNFISSFNVFKKHSLSPIKHIPEAKTRGYSLNSQYPEFIVASETSTKMLKGCIFKLLKL